MWASAVMSSPVKSGAVARPSTWLGRSRGVWMLDHRWRRACLLVPGLLLVE
ncbi:hypothetical protein BKP42_68090 [Rhodococcus erythropolis]|nr:hypothetical protein BKP42_68090 [Rhodococcus erythropolis]